MPRANDWQKRFGAERREIDRRILAAAEAQIVAEERAKPHEVEEWRAAIAKTFGRPLN
jgi:hypothetical protein